MNKVFKIILIVFLALFGFLVIVKGCGSSFDQSNPKELKQPNYVRVDTSYDYVIPKDSISVPGDILVNIYEYVINTFSDGSSIVLNYESPYVYMNLKYRLPDSSSLNVMAIARYYYSNYHYTNTITQKYYISYTDILLDSYSVNVGSYTFNNSAFISNSLSDISSGSSSIYLTEVNDDFSTAFGQGVASVINNPNNYDMYTKDEYLNYGSEKYQQGYESAPPQDLLSSGYKTFFNLIIASPYNVMKGIFNFNFLGVNLFDLFSFIITFLVLGWVVKKII